MSTKVKISKIEWIDADALEAEVWFEIDMQKFVAFCHPCDFIIGEIVNVSFSFIEYELPESSFWEGNNERERKISKFENDKCHYACYGQIQEIKPMIVDCGKIKFSFGDWINDNSVIKSYVYFVISRLDIFRS